MKTKKRTKSADLAEIITKVVGHERPLYLHEPEFGELDKKLVLDCIETGWVSSTGRYVEEFEKKICEFTGANYAVVVTNGTSALHLSLIEAGAGPQDEILCPAVTFVATANAISYVGATPHFIDSSLSTLGIDPSALDAYLETIAETKDGVTFNKHSGKKIRFIMPVHVFGHPVDMDMLVDVSNKHNLSIIEDASEGLGSFHNGIHVGLFGRSGVLSFNGNKILTTGGGGAIITDSIKIAERLKHLSTTAKVNSGYEFIHDEVGYNYRLPNLNAALGCAQIEHLPSALKRKRKLANKYKQEFDKHADFRFIEEPENCKSNFWLNAIFCENANHAEVIQIINDLEQYGIFCRPIWKLMPKLKMYSFSPKAPLIKAESIERTLISLPSSAKLGD